MTIHLRGLEHMSYLVGSKFPAADEDRLRRCAQAWRAAAQAVRQLDPAAISLGARVAADLGDDTGAAFSQLWNRLAVGDGLLAELAGNCDLLADGCEQAALDFEYAKIEYIAALVFLAAMLAWAAVTLVTGGPIVATAAVAAAQLTIRAILLRLVVAIGAGIAFNVALDGIAQVTQVIDGHRQSWDGEKTLGAAEDGAIFGAITGLTFGLGGRLAPGVMSTLLGKATALAVAGGAGGLVVPAIDHEPLSVDGFAHAVTASLASGLAAEGIHSRHGHTEPAELRSPDELADLDGLGDATDLLDHADLDAEKLGYPAEDRAEPERAEPDPTEPEPMEPAPTEPERTEPAPAKPEAAEPTEPEPAEPTEPERTEPEPAESRPTEPEPAEPEPGRPEPAEPEPGRPEPAEPAERAEAASTDAGRREVVPDAPGRETTDLDQAPADLAGTIPARADPVAPTDVPGGAGTPRLDVGPTPGSAGVTTPPRALGDGTGVMAGSPVGDHGAAEVTPAAPVLDGRGGADPAPTTTVDGEPARPRVDGPVPWRDPHSGTELTRSQVASIDAVLDRARLAEPHITETMREIAHDSGGQLLGEEQMFKSRDSTLGKAAIAVDQGRSFSSVLGRLGDTLRYTVGLPEESYVDGARHAMQDLVKRGFEPVRAKNSWGAPAGYKGLNTIWLDPATGHMFEIQFHTESSFRARIDSHDIYERRRALPDTEQGREQDAALKRLSDGYFAGVEVPAGSADLGLPRRHRGDVHLKPADILHEFVHAGHLHPSPGNELPPLSCDPSLDESGSSDACATNVDAHTAEAVRWSRPDGEEFVAPAVLVQGRFWPVPSPHGVGPIPRPVAAIDDTR